MEHETRQPTFLGADLGGTKLLLGEVTADGNLLRQKSYPSGALSQTQALELISDSVKDFLENARPKAEPQPCAMGVGLVGRVDPGQGLWMEIDRVRKEEFPVARLLEERFQLPCAIDNDVRSAAKAEMRFGQGKDCKNLIYLNIGTGIAAGIVVNGKLIRGGHCNAGEVGHTGSGVAIHVPCVCGRQDCVEMVSAGVGLDASARLLREQYPDTTLPIPEDGSRVSAAEIFSRYDSDPLCTLLTNNAAQGISNLIMNLVRQSDPELVVLGGGLLSNELLYQKVLAGLNAHTVRFVTRGIVRTGLDPAHIGVIGAACNAMEKLEQERKKSI